MCDRVIGSAIIKPLRFGTLTIAIERSAARLSIDRRVSAKNAADARGIAVRLLGLTCDPRPFERLHPGLVEGRRGARIPLTANVFEAVVWAIVGQQVNLAFAFRLRRSVISLASGRGELVAHPDPEAIAKLDYHDLTSRQFSRRKAEYLIDTARMIASGALDVEAMPDEDPASVRARLLAVRGFGEWSTNYVMMRACGFVDCVPLGDTGVTSSLQRFYNLDHRPGREETETLMKRFAPWRSLATFHLWMRLRDAAM